MDEIEVQKLIQKAKERDQDAFGQIYDLYAKQLYNFLLGKIMHKETAEDLVHAVFLKVWANIDSYETRKNTKFSTWLFQIANYTLIDHWRTKKPTVELSEIENLSRFAKDPELYEEYAYLWQAIALLPLQYQTVLDLRFKKDLSIKETAQIMGKSMVGVRVLQHRALKMLKEKLKDKI